jgi:hypothetical protein
MQATFKTYSFGLFGGVYTIRARDKHDAMKILRADVKEDGFHPNRANAATLLSVREDNPAIWK